MTSSRRLASVAMIRTALETKRWGGFTFEIDRPKGFVKTWDQPDGSVKKYTYPVDYGYFIGHTGEDDEGLDAFVGNDPKGKIESFLKMKEVDGKLVPDETKFLVGLTPDQREKVLALYKPEEITDLREYQDFYELTDVLADFRDKKAKKEAAGKPATPSQISYAKVLIEQGIRGLKGIPGWLKPGDAPTDMELASMDAVSISTLIDSLKARKPFKVEGYGNGAYKVVRKASMDPVDDPRADPIVQRVVARHLADTDLHGAILKQNEWLTSLWANVQVILDTFTSVVPLPYVGRIATHMHSQREVFQMCVQGVRSAEQVVNHCRTYLQLHPGNEEISQALQEAQDLYEKFSNAKETARKVLSALHQKILPTDLRQLTEGVMYGLREELKEPNRATVIVGHRLVPVELEERTVQAIAFDAYITVYPLPKDTEAGLPKYQQFILSQATLGDTAVYFQMIDRTNTNEPVGPVKVETVGAILKKIAGALKG